MDFGCFKIDVGDELSQETCYPNGHQDLNQFNDPFDTVASSFPSGFDDCFPDKFSPPSDDIESRVPTEGIQNMVLPFYITQTTVGDHVEPDLSRVSMTHILEPPMTFRYHDELLSIINSAPHMEVEMNKKKSMSMRRNGGKGQKKTKVVKGQWTLEEDRLLKSLVEKHGLRKWSQIAQMLHGRIGKQCRERWHNHLRPDIKKDTWSDEEDKILIQAHSEIGNKWAEIAKRLPGRAENSIKNHWNATKRRQFARRRRCRNTKNPKSSGMLLQDYIKSLAGLSSPPSSSPTKHKSSSKATVSMLEESSAAADAYDLSGHGDHLGAPACNFDDDAMAGLLLLEEEEKAVPSERYDVGYLFDQLDCSSPSINEAFEMEMEYWEEMRAMPLCCEDMKPEMDLVEMISQSSTSNNIKKVLK